MKKIRNKILLSMMLFTLLPVLLIGSYSVYTTTEALREVAINNQQNQMISNKRALEVLLNSVERDLFYLRESNAIQLYVTDKPSLPDIEAALEQFVNRNIMYSSVRLLDSKGQEVVHIERRNDVLKRFSGNTELLDQSESGYFIEASRLARHEVYISPLELRRVNGDIITPYQSTFRYASRVSGVGDQVEGVLVLELDASLLMQHAISEKHSGWRTLFVDPQGYLHFHGGSKEWQEGINTPDYQVSIFDDLSFGLSSIKDSKAYQLTESDSELNLSVPVFLEEGQRSLGYLINIAPKILVFKPLRDYLSISLIIVAICLLLSLLFAIILANSLSEPLLRLTKKVKNFSQGDLKTPIEADVHNEIGDLSQAMELLRKSMVILMKRSRKA